MAQEQITEITEEQLPLEGTQEGAEAEETEEEPEPEPALEIKILKASEEGTLTATAMDYLCQNLSQNYQVQLAHEAFDDPLVFDFKIISPDRMWLEVDTPLIPELERFTVANAGKPDTPLPRDLQRKLRRRNLLAELDLMDTVICAAVTNPPMSMTDDGSGVPVDRLPDPIKAALFNAIWQVSAPAAAEDYMAIFRKQSVN